MSDNVQMDGVIAIIQKFLSSGSTGQIRIDVKDGRMLSGKVIEYFRVDK